MTQLALLLMLIAYVPFVLALAAGLIAGATWLTFAASVTAPHGRPGRSMLVAAILLAAMWVGVGLSVLLLLAGLLPLFFRRVRPRMQYGRLIERHRHPKFFDLLDRICMRLGAAPPEEVYLCSMPNAFVAEFPTRDASARRQTQRVLAIGAELVALCSIEQLAAVLCHEIAHFSGRDTLWSRRVARFCESMAMVIGSHHSDSWASEDEGSRGWVQWLVYLALLAYFYPFAALYARDERRREFRADRAAAEICGPRAMQSVLIHLNVVAASEKLRVLPIVAEVVEHDRPLENAFEALRKRRTALPAAALARAEGAAFMENRNWFSSHPRLAERFRAVAQVESRGLHAPQPAGKLFTDWTTMELEMTAKLTKELRQSYESYLRAVVRPV